MKKPLFDWPIVLQYDVKAKYRLISRKFSGMTFFHPSVRLTKSHARVCIRSKKPIKSLYFRSFVISGLFARFYFKVIRKSLYFRVWHRVKQTDCFSWYCGKVGSQNDVTQQIETLNNTHTTTQKQINNGFRNIKKLLTNHSKKIQTRKFSPSDV